MKLYSLPKDLKNLIFDIDMTLYRHDAYYLSQTENQIRILSKVKGLDFTAMKDEIHQAQKEHFALHGTQTSFGNILKSLYGVTIEQSAQLRNQALEPEAFLLSDPLLREALVHLSSSYRLWALTNNAGAIGWRTLKVLGVDDIFPGLTALEDTGVSKPNPGSFLKALETSGFSPNQTLSVGDRYDVDIAPALKLGLGGALVEDMQDVYSLGNTLKNTAN